MKIARTQNNTNKPAFNGHIVIEMKKLNNKIRPEFINRIKTEIGEGLMSMPYKYNKQTMQNDCFVGFNDYNTGTIHDIIIATGKEDYNGKAAEAKKLQVDSVIIDKINSILSELGVKDPLYRLFTVGYERGHTGKIEKEGNKIKVVLNQYEHDYQEVYQYEKTNGKYKYAEDRRIEFEDLEEGDF